MAFNGTGNGGAFDAPKEITLSCGHSRYFRPPLPDIRERVWCPACEKYKYAGDSRYRSNREIHLDGCWMSIPKRVQYQGVCLGKDMQDCELGYIANDRNWYRLKERMERHYLEEHAGNTRPLFDFANVPIPLPKGAAPPF